MEKDVEEGMEEDVEEEEETINAIARYIVIQ